MKRWWSERRGSFWRNASHGAGLAALAFGVVGVANGIPALVGLAVSCGVLTLTFGRRSRP
jgi:hypothetical protein